MKIIVISNQKGGVGKSTIAVHYLLSLIEKNLKVCFIDLDPQANASSSVKKIKNMNLSEIKASHLFLSHLKTTKNTESILIEADSSMANIESQKTGIINNFKDNLDVLSNEFDYCIIDTPPTLGLRMTASLIVADYVMSPIELEEYGIDGITKMLKTIYGIKEKYNSKLEFIGMITNRYNARSPSQRKVFKEILDNYSSLLIPAYISTRSTIPEALNQGVPVWKLRKTSARLAGSEFKKVFKFINEKIGINL